MEKKFLEKVENLKTTGERIAFIAENVDYLLDLFYPVDKKVKGVNTDAC